MMDAKILTASEVEQIENSAILKDALADVPRCLWGTYSVEASIY